ncbi:type 2 periplasmic-binding domain-containing protein [Kibdelosporangium aridum]|uniref:Uncharacterized protein n=1 Tax=Kibdelosporangium aridum TaxID=2030 RepID=A0A1W2FXU8_KIBAR|nr:hypothetical protein [Kibdelosporangium aridum]SMD26466.1 hypothetical protein SAMN05661093_10049 [Kibdelosporangium aridum]
MLVNDLFPLDLSRLGEFNDKLRGLLREGWHIPDSVVDIRLHKPTEDVQADINRVQVFGSTLDDLEVVGVIAGHRLRLRTVQGILEVVDFPGADPYLLFDDDDVNNAHLAWDGDATAALLLPLNWTITAFLKPESSIQDLPEGIEVVVVTNSNTIVAHFREAGLRNLARFVPPEMKRRIYISLEGDAPPVHLGTISFATISAPFQLQVPIHESPLPGEAALHKSSLIRPYCLLAAQPIQASAAVFWKEIVDYCRAAASIYTWVSLASNVQVSEAGVRIEFLGFRRVSFQLPPPESLEVQKVSSTLILREWAFQEASPDRLLAISQVVSLYDQDDPFQHAEDIKASAEVIYVGLRSDAVAEVVKTSRDAYTQTNETVRQALKSSQDLIKASMERFLAGLVAVGAVTIANASRALTDDMSRLLMLFIAGFFVVLALVALVIEGPLLSLQIKNLHHDVRQGAPLLTEDQIRSITESRSVTKTRIRVQTVRIAIPVIYGSLVCAIAIWGYP